MILLDDSPWLLELKASFANRPERAPGLSIPVDRISLYSSTDRPLKLVSLGRGYWSHGTKRTERVGERLVLQYNLRPDDTGEALLSPYVSPHSSAYCKPEAQLEEQRHLEVKYLASLDGTQESSGKVDCVIQEV